MFADLDNLDDEMDISRIVAITLGTKPFDFCPKHRKCSFFQAPPIDLSKTSLREEFMRNYPNDDPIPTGTSKKVIEKEPTVEMHKRRK